MPADRIPRKGRADENILVVRNLEIAARLENRRRAIVTGIDLRVGSGETVGIVGESGSGKSLMARALLNLMPDGVVVRGEVRFQGRNLLALREAELRALRGREIALILQDPYTMLNPLRSCGLHIVELLRDAKGHKLRKDDRRREAVRRLAEVGIRDATVCDRYPFQLSGGMRQRVGIAAALSLDPKILVADEPSTALDVTTQREILALLKSLQESRGMGLVLITHDLRVAFAMCDRVYVMYAGTILEAGSADDVEGDPRHPYTLALLLSEPPGDRRVESLAAIGGNVPSADEVGEHCAFAPRCVWATAECEAARPRLVGVGDQRVSACCRGETILHAMRAHREEAQQSHATAAPSPRGAEEIVLIRELRKTFHVGQSGRGKAEVTAVGGVSLTIRSGESVGLVGESGSGKSTLARCLVGLETPSGGSIFINGTDATNFRRMSNADRSVVRRMVQMIFQDPYSSLNPVRTVEATLREALTVGGVDHSALAVKVAELLGQVGLPESFGSRKPVSLSGGERQRVAIARALAVGPALLICDEPVSALDVSVQAQILNLFKAIRGRQDVGYLFISHDLAVVRQVVDRVYVMFEGLIVEEGDVDEVLDRPKHAYTASLIDSLPRSDDTWLTIKRARAPGTT
jgi:peptide/nickel transport system ATP-binding protein